MIQSEIDYANIDYDALEVQNVRAKDAFVNHARFLFGDEFFVPDGPNIPRLDREENPDLPYCYNDMYNVSWHYLFLEYSRLLKCQHSGHRKEIYNIVKNLYTENLWYDATFDFREKLFGVITRHSDELVARRHDAIIGRQRGFLHNLTLKDVGREKNFTACYSEDFAIPNHSSIVAQVPVFCAAKKTSDLLYCDAEHKQTFSIKMVSENTNPKYYRQIMVGWEYRNCPITMKARLR